MVQSWNWAGVYWALRSLAMQRGLVVPHFRVPDIRSINWRALQARGCLGVVFDKDNTLTAPYAPAVFPTLLVLLPSPVSILILLFYFIICVLKEKEDKKIIR